MMFFKGKSLCCPFFISRKRRLANGRRKSERKPGGKESLGSSVPGRARRSARAGTHRGPRCPWQGSSGSRSCRAHRWGTYPADRSPRYGEDAPHLMKKTKDLKSHDFRSFGGDKRDRTADLLNAIQALSQLSYTPVSGCPPLARGKIYNIRPRVFCQGFF